MYKLKQGKVIGPTRGSRTGATVGERDPGIIRPGMVGDDMMKKFAILFALTLWLSMAAAMEAAETDCSQAVADFNAHRYQRAFNQFKSLSEKYPDNEVVHYYLALCHQAMGRMKSARQEYKWVLDHGSSKLKAHAKKGISQIGQAAAPDSTEVATITGTGSQPDNKIDNSARAENPVSPGAKPTAAKQAPSQGKVSKVIDFYADWCAPCKLFEPVFEAASQKMTGVKFEKIKIDEDRNRSLVDKFNIHSIPRLVILDARGKALYNDKPPQDEESFAALIKKYD